MCCVVRVLRADDGRGLCLVCLCVGVWVFFCYHLVCEVRGGNVFVFFRYFAGAIVWPSFLDSRHFYWLSSGVLHAALGGFIFRARHSSCGSSRGCMVLRSMCGWGIVQSESSSGKVRRLRSSSMYSKLFIRCFRPSVSAFFRSRLFTNFLSSILISWSTWKVV